jgi:uncharacterized protein (UPF0371 family)
MINSINQSTILYIQAKTDTLELRKDVMAGLYDRDFKEYAEQANKILDKMEKARELRGFEREQILADLTEERETLEEKISSKDEEHYYQEQGRL